MLRNAPSAHSASNDCKPNPSPTSFLLMAVIYSGEANVLKTSYSEARVLQRVAPKIKIQTIALSPTWPTASHMDPSRVVFHSKIGENLTKNPYPNHDWVNITTLLKLSIHQLIYIPSLTDGHELWVVIERMRLRIQAAETSIWLSDIRWELRSSRCSLGQQHESAEVVRASD